jgi:hypothetical protein
MGLSLFGLAGTTLALLPLVLSMLDAITLMQPWTYSDYAEAHPQAAALGAWCSSLTFAVWCWSLASSIALLRANPAPPPSSSNPNPPPLAK